MGKIHATTEVSPRFAKAGRKVFARAQEAWVCTSHSLANVIMDTWWPFVPVVSLTEWQQCIMSLQTDMGHSWNERVILNQTRLLALPASSWIETEQIEKALGKRMRTQSVGCRRRETTPAHNKLLNSLIKYSQKKMEMKRILKISVQNISAKVTALIWINQACKTDVHTQQVCKMPRVILYAWTWFADFKALLWLFWDVKTDIVVRLKGDSSTRCLAFG